MNPEELIMSIELTSYWIQLLFALWGSFLIFGSFILVITRGIKSAIP